MNTTVLPPLTPNAPVRELLPQISSNPECRASTGLCFAAGKIFMEDYKMGVLHPPPSPLISERKNMEYILLFYILDPHILP
jgi:hypothetical protein